MLCDSALGVSKQIKFSFIIPKSPSTTVSDRMLDDGSVRSTVRSAKVGVCECYNMCELRQYVTCYQRRDYFYRKLELGFSIHCICTDTNAE